MATITISPKYQLVSPKKIREKLHLKSGQKMTMVTKGGVTISCRKDLLKPSGGF
jgi:AbrB family looped-hinge helix DNA binding protein